MYDITKLKTLPEQVYENTVKLNEEILPAVEIAIERSEEATAKANEAITLADSAKTTADTAVEMANTNKEAIEALGEFDAEAIANLTADVNTLKETTSAQEIEISTVVAQVDAAEDDITDMKSKISQNTMSIEAVYTEVDRASRTAEEALTKANDNASSIVDLNDELLDLGETWTKIYDGTHYVTSESPLTDVVLEEDTVYKIFYSDSSSTSPARAFDIRLSKVFTTAANLGGSTSNTTYYTRMVKMFIDDNGNLKLSGNVITTSYSTSAVTTVISTTTGIHVKAIYELK